MGTVIGRTKFNASLPVFRLLIFADVPGDGIEKTFSMNKPLAEELLLLKPRQRTMQIEKCFCKLLNELPEMPTIKDIDVMFNPAYKVDVMKILVSAYKQKPYKLIWPGTIEDDRLIYSQEGRPDYKFYEINDYDILCVK